MKKQNWFYTCKHCRKKYPTFYEANLCFKIDMNNIKKESKILTKKIYKNENKNH